MQKRLRDHKRRLDWYGSALTSPKGQLFSKKTKIGKQRRASLATAYKTSRKTGKSLYQLRSGR